MSEWITKLKINLFRNADRFDKGKPMSGGPPQWGNSSLTLHSDLKAGTYSIGCWQYSDTGNLSLKFDQHESEDVASGLPKHDSEMPREQPQAAPDAPIDWLEPRDAKRNVADDFS